MRSLLVTCLLASIASADPKPYSTSVVTKGQVGDWTLFESDRRADTGMVRERAVAMIAAGTDKRVILFRGAVDTERLWSDSLFLRLIELTNYQGTRRVAATCKLDTSFPCTKVIFAGVDGRGPEPKPSPKVTVTATLAERIRGSGIVEIEVKQDGVVQWRIKVIGYGTAEKTLWGKPASKAKLDLPPEPTGSAISSGFDPEIASDFIAYGVQSVHEGPLSSVVVQGDLDLGIVRRYLKRNLAKLRFCYEKALVAKPTLAGRIDYTFTIAKTGQVSSATAKGLDPEVERCAADAIKNIDFPKPKGGKPVDVTFWLDHDPPKKP